MGNSGKRLMGLKGSFEGSFKLQYGLCRVLWQPFVVLYRLKMQGIELCGVLDGCRASNIEA